MLPITQMPVYNHPYRSNNPPFAMTPSDMRYSYPGPPQGKGGILQNLFSGVFPQVNGGSGMTINAIMEKLDQLQRMLGVVQKGAPIIQQYGPMIKQLPAMLELIKALNDTDTEQTSEDGDKGESDDHAFNDSPLTNNSEETKAVTEKSTQEESSIKQPTNGQSTPKLFI